MTLTVFTDIAGDKAAFKTSELTWLNDLIMRPVKKEVFPDTAGNRQCALMGLYDKMRGGKSDA